MTEQKNNPLHGKRLDFILEELYNYYGSWEAIGTIVKINCFTKNPSLKSSLTFLRKTPWARLEVEQLYLRIFHEQ